jgi:hypothetical protein
VFHSDVVFGRVVLHERFFEEFVMVNAGEFVMYCAGVGTLLISAAGAVRLVFGPQQRQINVLPQHEQQPTTQRHVDTSEALNERLRSFQGSRYATVPRRPPMGTEGTGNFTVPERLLRPRTQGQLKIVKQTKKA